MPLTVFDCKGIPATRRARIEAAVQAGGKNLPDPGIETGGRPDANPDLFLSANTFFTNSKK